MIILPLLKRTGRRKAGKCRCPWSVPGKPSASHITSHFHAHSGLILVLFFWATQKSSSGSVSKGNSWWNQLRLDLLQGNFFLCLLKKRSEETRHEQQSVNVSSCFSSVFFMPRSCESKVREGDGWLGWRRKKVECEETWEGVRKRKIPKETGKWSVNFRTVSSQYLSLLSSVSFISSLIIHSLQHELPSSGFLFSPIHSLSIEALSLFFLCRQQKKSQIFHSRVEEE